jgi:cyclopropane fatty-acyl-phospholipid synthase-like methyltransferase
MTSRDERQALSQFGERYALPGSRVAAEIEQRVIGAVWGANGYTTLEQADQLTLRLELGPGQVLLDVGTGRGWPGLYIGVSSGCTVVGSDLPLDALKSAAARARREGISERVGLAVAGGAAQPFRAESFDAVVHTDVLC